MSARTLRPAGCCPWSTQGEKLAHIPGDSMTASIAGVGIQGWAYRVPPTSLFLAKQWNGWRTEGLSSSPTVKRVEGGGYAQSSLSTMGGRHVCAEFSLTHGREACMRRVVSHTQGGYIPAYTPLLAAQEATYPAYTPLLDTHPGRLHTRHIHHYTPRRLHTRHIPPYVPRRLHTRHIPPYIHQGGYIPGYTLLYTPGRLDTRVYTLFHCWADPHLKTETGLNLSKLLTFRTLFPD